MDSVRIADAVLRRVRERFPETDAAAWLTGRAALLGLVARGRVSPGGATHLLRAADGWCALTLSRDDDIAAVPALLETDTCDALVADPWPAVQRWAADCSADQVSARAQLLDLPVARLAETTPRAPVTTRLGARGPARRPEGLLVADLTSMWAGPLCGQLWARAGATVVKVESPHRPDGTRRGNRAFFDWVNAEKLSYAADFDADARALGKLLEAADVVLEGSRPAALSRRGLGPTQRPGRPGRVWLRITGHPDGGRRVAFGDDAAVAGGLVGRDDDGPVFMGDALADPLTGLEAYRAVTESLARGGGELIEVALAAVAADYARYATGPASATPATAPRILSAAAELGADNAAVVQLVAARTEAPC